ncbi:MBL fold metallo-hydrolase [Gordonia sp. TBRC 11910]|uniref:MBL fold metallo-hydrolase n=1 Tax=Gordonia asplenii TaxID=2725283 RepID=A0A848L248_9ACTN|nr:MBL fold metallo-hydrolase [Gordonia asplenii]NMO04866.1 MBL fold metallo-hydrolase [Gordonia asplenii]
MAETSSAPSAPHVSVETDHATITALSVGPMDNNVYVVTCRETGDQLLIDAANDADRIEALLADLPGQVTTIMTTHQHPDHVQALEAVHAAHPGVPTAVGRDDAPALPVAPDILVDDGDTLRVGNLTLDAIHLIGHTPGSIALALSDTDADHPQPRTHLFTGDCLFPGGVGKTWKPEDFVTLYRDVSTKLFGRYADDTEVYPGHGSGTTLGAERGSLAEWEKRGW